jgi:hypothetical protein
MNVSEIIASLTAPSAADAQERATTVVFIAGGIALALIILIKLWRPQK